MNCFPAWHKTFAIYNGRPSAMIIRSGCSTSNGNVQCSPESMRAKAEAYMFSVGWKKPVTLAMYTLARYMASEVGSGTIEEKVAVGECARNRANLVWKLPGGVLQLLLYRQGTGHPNRGYYGPIHAGSGDTRTSPYGRWAATSRDPTIGDVVLADFVLSGSDFAKGADDQNGPNGLTYPYQKPIEQAKSRNYWVGPLPGINVWHTMLVKHMPYVSPDSMIGKMLVQQAIEGLKATEIYKNKAPDWSQVPICPPVFFTAQRVFALGIGTAISFLTLRHLTQTGFISPIS